MLEPCKSANDAGKYKIAQTWSLEKDEDIYGLGQLRLKNMSWRGQKVESETTTFILNYVVR